jgi:hypothetical protein
MMVGECGINLSDDGRTEIAWVELVDDETGQLRTRASVAVSRQPIPHTEDEERVFSSDDVSVELFALDEGEETTYKVSQKLLEETNAVEVLRRVCRKED